MAWYREVRQSLNRSLLHHLVQDTERQTAKWYTNNHIADYKGYYASVFYSYFAALGYEITVEDSTSHGRLDMAVRTGGQVYLFEFKVVEMEPEGAALAQLQSRNYAAKYRHLGAPIHLIGVEFSRQSRNVTAFAVAADQA